MSLHDSPTFFLCNLPNTCRTILSVDDLDRTILETYLKILPTLSETDLHARLARRKTAVLNRPPRPWCLAVRASATRINNDTAIIIPYPAIRFPTQPPPHQLVLDPRLI